MSTFFIGCLHLGHENMAKHRGFADSEDHDLNLIEQWNKVITKRDKVFILGDVSMESSKPYHLLDQLQGYKHVVLGNHDDPKDVRKLLEYVDKVSGPFRYKKEYWLSHIPVHPIEFDYRIRVNIHAHIHELELNDKRYFKVDAKHLKYKPISFDEIVATVPKIEAKKIEPDGLI